MYDEARTALARGDARTKERERVAAGACNHRWTGNELVNRLARGKPMPSHPRCHCLKFRGRGHYCDDCNHHNDEHEKARTKP